MPRVCILPPMLIPSKLEMRLRIPVLGAERKVERLGRTQEHVGVWMCWVRVRSEVRRVWKVDGRRMGRVRARDSIVCG